MEYTVWNCELFQSEFFFFLNERKTKKNQEGPLPIKALID